MNRFKKLFDLITPHLLAILFFLIIAVVYFNPVLYGKKIFQSDVANFEGMSHEIKKFREATGEEALWTNSMFCGMPAYQISVLYKGNLMPHLDNIFQFGLPHPANLVFLCFLGFYFLLLCMRLNPWISIAGAVAFGFSSYFFIIIEAGHDTKAHAIAYMAPVVAGVILTYRGKFLTGGIITALFLALEIYANHFQITYYLGLTLLIFGITMFYDAVKNKTMPAFLKSSAVIAIAVILASSTNIANLWSTLEYGKYTTRGTSDLTITPAGTSNTDTKTDGLAKDYATDWSYGIAETFTLLIPNFYGGSSTRDLNTDSHVYKELKLLNFPDAESYIKDLPVYWGEQPFTSGPVYVGAIVCFLFVLGLFIVKGGLKWWLLAATVFSIVLAWGKNYMSFNEWMLDYFPAYNKFRAVSMTLVIAEFTMPLLAFLALKEIFENNISREEIIKKLKYSFGLVGGLLMFFILFAGSLFTFSCSSDSMLTEIGWPDFLLNALYEDRKWLLKKDAIFSFVYITITTGVIWAFLKQKLQHDYAIAIIIFAILIDMWAVNKDYLNDKDFVSKTKIAVPYHPTQADQEILADTTLNYRVFNTSERLDQDSRTSYFHKNLGGYHGAKLKRYDELIDFHLNKGNRNVMNMLNAKYFIVPDSNGIAGVQPNPRALGNAWFVNEYKIVAGADSEITAMNDFNPATTAIVDQRFSSFLEGFSTVSDSDLSINLLEYKPNYLKYQSKTNTEQLCVFSEIYYDKGWNAFIDGNSAPYFRANYVLRVMRIPSGKHIIEFRFEPRSYFIGEKISYAGSLLLFILVGAGIYLEIRKKFKINPESY